MSRIDTRTRLADGREILYFDDAGLRRAPPASLVDHRELPARPEPGQLRFDALTGEWVAVAAHRQSRTHLPPADQCPICPTTPANPTEIPAPDYDVAVFENRFPSLGPARARSRRAPVWGTTAPRRPLRGGGLHPAAHRVLRRAGLAPDPHGDRRLGPPHRSAQRAARHPAGLPVRKPRRRNRRHPAPPARADLRLPLRHAPRRGPGRRGRRILDDVRRHGRRSPHPCSGPNAATAAAWCSRANTSAPTSPSPPAGRWKSTSSRTARSRTSPP